MQAASYCIMLLLRFRHNPALGPPVTGITWPERFRSLKGIWGMVALILLVMGSMYTGFATPTEAAGVGALGSLLMAAPRLTFKGFWNAMVETARTTAMIFAIVAGVLIYVHFLGFTGMPAAIADGIVHLDLPPTVVLIGILALYLILACSSTASA